VAITDRCHDDPIAANRLTGFKPKRLNQVLVIDEMQRSLGFHATAILKSVREQGHERQTSLNIELRRWPTKERKREKRSRFYWI
jgi:hypothetical protein